MAEPFDCAPSCRPLGHRRPRERAFCIHCGSPMAITKPPEESRPRLVCTACGYIFYENPKVVVATIPSLGGRVVLVRRAIEPRLGTWSYPGGFLELGESAEEGALRETKEETNLDVAINGLLSIYSRPDAGVVVVVYAAQVVGGEPVANSEVSEIGRFRPNEIPWQDLSFPTTESALNDWVTRYADCHAASD